MVSSAFIVTNLRNVLSQLDGKHTLVKNQGHYYTKRGSVLSITYTDSVVYITFAATINGRLRRKCISLPCDKTLFRVLQEELYRSKSNTPNGIIPVILQQLQNLLLSDVRPKRRKA